jgi:hypothetical protein
MYIEIPNKELIILLLNDLYNDNENYRILVKS